MLSHVVNTRGSFRPASEGAKDVPALESVAAALSGYAGRIASGV